MQSKELPEFHANVYRDCDTLRLRKVVVEIYSGEGDDEEVWDRTRMFAGPTPRLFERRLQRRITMMLKRTLVMATASLQGKPL